jgi:hypothetical protein
MARGRPSAKPVAAPRSGRSTALPRLTVLLQNPACLFIFKTAPHSGSLPPVDPTGFNLVYVLIYMNTLI